ncbi:MAG TPA: SagB/ThcOx family dehydrogenase [Polyangiales bacterium]|nr:SagB/ThcOx family dehydrogenase [Polyangiales bacterium]
MTLITKWLLGRLGRLHPVSLAGPASALLELPAPNRVGGMPLMEALAKRHSEREFAPTPLSQQQLSDLLWAADGINRPELQEHTAPSAMNAQEVDIYVALAAGLYRYDAVGHVLELVASSDARSVTGIQDFVDTAALDLVYVADHARMKLIPQRSRETYAAICVGAITQNVSLYCASAGLASVVRGLFDATLLGDALGLSEQQTIVLTQTVGCTRA